MEKIIIICSIAVIVIGASLFTLAKYREYLFKKKSNAELMDILRRSRKTYSRFTYEEITSSYGRLLLRSIIAMETELKSRVNA